MPATVGSGRGDCHRKVEDGGSKATAELFGRAISNAVYVKIVDAPDYLVFFSSGNVRGRMRLSQDRSRKEICRAHFFRTTFVPRRRNHRWEQKPAAVRAGKLVEVEKV